MKYWIHPESDSYLESETHPGDLCVEIDYLTYVKGICKMSNYKRVKNLTLDILKFVEMEPRHVKITGPIHLGKEQKSSKDDDKKRDPAHLAHCIDLDTGAECQIIVAAVVLSVLNDEYPGEAYVGKCFAITKKNRVAGKQYFPYAVEEIEDPGKPAVIAEASKAGHAGGKRA